jgi:PAS domain S-box-containing protein
MTLMEANHAAGLTEQDLVRLGQSVLRDIPDAVIYADHEGAIRFWNAGAERIFGFSPDEALGQSLDIIIPERLRQRHWDGYRHMMNTGQSQHRSDELLAVPAQTKSGQTLSVQFTVAAVRDPDGALAGIVAVLRDVTATFQELKRLRAGKLVSES